MPSVRNFYRSRYFWIIAVFVVLIALSWGVWGALSWGDWAWLRWSQVAQWIVTSGLLVLCIVVLVYEFYRASRSAKQIEESLSKQAERQRMSSRPDRRSEIEELQERFEEAIEKLKQSQLGEGQRGETALYALPWYVFIGPPGAGKTTAVQNSGLNFPIGDSGVKGIGGTRNCDWFFTDQAILLDTAGRYMTEREDEEEWLAFLDMLKEHRPDRPINGVLVGISVNRLAEASPSDIKRHADNIRRRISELVEQLGVRFPVYLVFTKCDLLQGFVEFFGDMTRQEREQIWGCTFTEEQREEESPRDLFEQEFDRLQDALINVRAERLSRSMKREDRRKVYAFPLQFASVKENLSAFVDQLFQENPYQENPKFRGFYFTSGTQEGTPIDRVIQSVAEKFDFAPAPADETDPEGEPKSYFLKDLFTDVVVPDEDMVERTSSATQRRVRQEWKFGAVTSILCALCLGGLAVSYNYSEDALSRLAQAHDDVEKVAAQETNSRAVLLEVDTLSRQIDEYESSFLSSSYLLRLPFYHWHDDEVIRSARSLQRRTMRRLVRPHFDALEDSLQAGLRSAQEPLALRRQLGNYRLLSDSSRALREQQGYREQLIDYLVSRLSSSPAATSSAGHSIDRSLVEKHVRDYVDYLQNSPDEGSFSARSDLIVRASRAITRRMTTETLYARIKGRVMDQLPSSPKSVESILQNRGSSGENLFASSSATVSPFFSKEGWGRARKRIEERAQAPSQGGLIEAAAGPSGSLQNTNEVKERLRERYFREYSNAWRQFVRGIRYTSFSNTPRVVGEDLKTLGRSVTGSPLLSILREVKEQTDFTSRLQDEARRKLQQKGQSIPDSLRHPVNTRFQELHRLVRDWRQNQSQSDLGRAFQALRTAGEDVSGFEGRSAFASARQVLGEKEHTLETEMSSLNDLPIPIRRLFEGPLVAGWQAVLAETQRYLNDQWEKEVYSYYVDNLEGNYPVSGGSRTECRLQDFKRFFRKGGIISSFRSEYLDPFFQNGTLQTKSWEEQNLKVSSSTKQLLRRSEQIRKGLWPGNSFGFEFSLKPRPKGSEPPERAPAPGAFRIRVHGQEQAYKMGIRTQKSFKWPGEEYGARLQVEGRGGATIAGPMAFDGPWAWFRFLDETAAISPNGNLVAEMTWRLDAPEDRGNYSFPVTYELTSDDFTSEAFSNVFLQPGRFLRVEVPETID